MKIKLTVITAAALMALSSPVLAGNGNGKGKAVGQNDALLAATKCSNNGKV